MSVKKIISFLPIVLAIVTIPFALSMAKQRNTFESEASAKPVQLILSPKVKTVNIKRSINIKISMNTGGNRVKDLAFITSYPSDLLELVGIIDQRDRIRNRIEKKTQTPGTYQFVGTAQNKKYINKNNVPLVTLRFRAKQNGIATIAFTQIKITGDQQGNPELPTEHNTSLITIGNGSGPTTTETPNPSPSGTTPSISPAPTQTLPLCDFDNNGFPSMGDYDVWVAEIRGTSDTLQSDCDHDGTITIFDYTKWLDELRKIHNN